MDGKLDVINRSRELKKTKQQQRKEHYSRCTQDTALTKVNQTPDMEKLSSLSPALTHTTMQKYDQSCRGNFNMVTIMQKGDL